MRANSPTELQRSSHARQRPPELRSNSNVRQRRTQLQDQSQCVPIRLGLGEGPAGYKLRGAPKVAKRRSKFARLTERAATINVGEVQHDKSAKLGSHLWKANSASGS